MKRTLTKFLAIVVCLHGLAWHAVESRRQQGPISVATGYDLAYAFSPEHAQYLPKEFAEAEVEDLKVSPSKLSFTINGFPMFIEWIGKPGRLISFNNRIFTEKDFRNEKAFNKAFLSKFGIFKNRRNSMNSLLFERAFAAIDDGLFDDATAAVSNDEDEVEEEENRVGFEFEGQDGEEGFNAYVRGDRTFTDDNLFGRTEAGRLFDARTRMVSGDNMMAMIRTAMIFQGSIGFAMNPAGGYNPGFGLMNNLGNTPIDSIPLPDHMTN